MKTVPKLRTGTHHVAPGELSIKVFRNSTSYRNYFLKFTGTETNEVR